MGNFDLAYQFVKKAEGGYSNHKNDRGGETNYGITRATFDDAKKLGIISDSIKSVKDITQDDAKKIYKEMYWNKINGDALPADLAIALFDTAVNMGVGASVKMLQKIIGVPQDGVLGSETLAAINNYNGDLVDTYLDAREAKYYGIVERDSRQGVFLKGWLSRVSSLRGYIENNASDSSFIPLWIRNLFQSLKSEAVNLYRQIFGDAFGSAAIPTRRDPAVVDIDGDGIETTNVKDGAYFDHDGNGFAEQTGWAGADDGLLVMDRNNDGIINDGRELFGDQTILSNGQRASNGFQALSELDSNKDGKIDAADTAFANLKVWQDTDGDGYSTSDELHTLDEVGIKSINLTSTPNTVTDPQGNTQTRTGTFEKTDGTTGIVGEYNLQRDTAYTIANEWLDVPDDIAALPDIQGYGNVYDLQQAMARERLTANGEGLKGLIEQFMAITDIATRNTLMEQILYKWTGSEGIDPNSRGANIDARKLAVLEKFFGQPFVSQYGTNPIYESSILLKEAYRGLSEMMYSQLMAQTHLKDIYSKINYTWDDAIQSIKADMSAVITELQNSLSTDSEAGKNLLGEFSRTIRGFGAQEMVKFLFLLMLLTVASVRNKSLKVNLSKGVFLK
jgi:lysozyme family protein